jgi:hypothetical protein
VSIPGYWMNETSGVLKPVVLKYLDGQGLDSAEVSIIRAYLQQWIGAPAFVGPDVVRLRERVDQIMSTDDVRDWLADALDAGVDPL